MCRAPLACVGNVYVHVAAVIAACIVCIVLFVIVTIRQRQPEEHQAKPVPEQVMLKEGLHRGIDCKEEDLLGRLTTCW